MDTSNQHESVLGQPAFSSFASSAERVVARSPACLGLVESDGHISVLSNRLSRELGFDRPEDLKGLRLNSLWQHQDRGAVASAFETARNGRSGQAAVDMAHLSAQASAARVTFSPAQGGCDIVMTFDWTSQD